MTMEDPHDFWKDSVDIATTMSADFGPRNTRANVWDKWGTYRCAASQMGEQLGCSDSVCADYAVRVYIAHVCDSMDYDVMDVRKEQPQTWLSPPHLWLDDNREQLPTFDVDIVVDRSIDQEMYGFQTVAVVYEMVETLVSQYDLYESNSEFFKRALTFVADGYVDDGKLLEDRPTSTT